MKLQRMAHKGHARAGSSNAPASAGSLPSGISVQELKQITALRIAQHQDVRQRPPPPQSSPGFAASQCSPGTPLSAPFGPGSPNLAPVLSAPPPVPSRSPGPGPAASPPPPLSSPLVRNPRVAAMPMPSPPLTGNSAGSGGSNHGRSKGSPVTTSAKQHKNARNPPAMTVEELKMMTQLRLAREGGGGSGGGSSGSGAGEAAFTSPPLETLSLSPRRGHSPLPLRSGPASVASAAPSANGAAKQGRARRPRGRRSRGRGKEASQLSGDSSVSPTQSPSPPLVQQRPQPRQSHKRNTSAFSVDDALEGMGSPALSRGGSGSVAGTPAAPGSRDSATQEYAFGAGASKKAGAAPRVRRRSKQKKLGGPAEGPQNKSPNGDHGSGGDADLEAVRAPVAPGGQMAGRPPRQQAEAPAQAQPAPPSAPQRGPRPSLSLESAAAAWGGPKLGGSSSTLGPRRESGLSMTSDLEEDISYQVAEFVLLTPTFTGNAELEAQVNKQRHMNGHGESKLRQQSSCFVEEGESAYMPNSQGMGGHWDERSQGQDNITYDAHGPPQAPSRVDSSCYYMADGRSQAVSALKSLAGSELPPGTVSPIMSPVSRARKAAPQNCAPPGMAAPPPAGHWLNASSPSSPANYVFFGGDEGHPDLQRQMSAPPELQGVHQAHLQRQMLELSQQLGVDVGSHGMPGAQLHGGYHNNHGQGALGGYDLSAGYYGRPAAPSAFGMDSAKGFRRQVSASSATQPTTPMTPQALNA